MGFLVPFQNCLVFPCSHTFSLLFPCLAHILTTFPHHQHRHLVVLAFPNTRSCSLRYFSLVPLFPCSPKPLGNPHLTVSANYLCNVKSRPGCFQHSVQYVGKSVSVTYSRAIEFISAGHAVKICCEKIKQQIANNWMRKIKIQVEAKLQPKKQSIHV